MTHCGFITSFVTALLALLMLTNQSIAADAPADMQQAIDLLRHHDAIIVVGHDAPQPLQQAASALAKTTGHPLAQDIFFIRHGKRSWAFNGWYSGKTLIAIGTPQDNTVIAEWFYTERSRPVSWWHQLTPDLAVDDASTPVPVAQIPVAQIRCFPPGSLTAMPWLGAPSLFIGGSDVDAITAQVDALRKHFGAPAKHSVMDAWYEHVMVATRVDETSRESGRHRTRQFAARNERLWVKVNLRSEAALEGAILQQSSWQGPDQLPPLEVYMLARRGTGQDRVDVDEVMIPLSTQADGHGWRTTLPSIAAATTTSLLVEYQIPSDARAGEYETMLKLVAGEGEKPIVLPFSLTVHDFALPVKMPVPVYFYANLSPVIMRDFFNLQSDDEYEQAVRDLARQIQKYGATVAPSIDYTDTVHWVMIEGKPGQYRMDYSRFDQLLGWLREEGLDGPYLINVRLDRPRRTRLFHTVGQSSIYDEQGVHHILRKDRGEQGPRVPLAWRNAALRNQPWLEDLKKHLDARGLADQVRIYAADEPSDLTAYRKDIQPILDAGLRPISSINKTQEPEKLAVLDDVMDPWILLYHPWERDGESAMHDVWQPFARARRAAGQQVWWYHCLGLVAQSKNFNWSRKFAWHSWKYDVDGIAFWSPLSIYTIGSVQAQQVRKGQRETYRQLYEIPWDDFPNSAMAFYNDVQHKRLLASRRMAVVAQGWEDYKYLHVLDELIASGKADASAVRHAVQVRDEAYDTLMHAPGLAQPFDEARRKIALAIESLQQAD